MKPSNPLVWMALAFLAIAALPVAQALSCASAGPKIGIVSLNGSLSDVRGFSGEFASLPEVVEAYQEGRLSETESFVWNPEEIVLSAEAQERFTPRTGDVHAVVGMGPMCASSHSAFYRDGDLFALEYASSYRDVRVGGQTYAFVPADREDCGELYCEKAVRLSAGDEAVTLSVGESHRFDGFTVFVLRSDIVPEQAQPHEVGVGPLTVMRSRGSGWEEDHLQVLFVAEDKPLRPGDVYCDGTQGPCWDPGSSGDPEICAQVITRARNPETGEFRDFPTPCDVPAGWETILPVEPDGGIGDGAGPLEPEMCIQVIAYAENPETGEIQVFPTPCDVPAGWQLAEEPIPVEPDGGIGDGAKPLPFEGPRGIGDSPSIWKAFTRWLGSLF